MENKRDGKQDLELCQKATPGPWQYEPESFTPGEYGEPPSGEPPAVIYPIRVGGVDGFNVSNGDNAEFIAESREALPHWIIRALVAERANVYLNEKLAKSTFCPIPASDKCGGMTTDCGKCTDEYFTQKAIAALREEGIEID
jgi:hypothetical protein